MGRRVKTLATGLKVVLKEPVDDQDPLKKPVDSKGQYVDESMLKCCICGVEASLEFCLLGLVKGRYYCHRCCRLGICDEDADSAGPSAKRARHGRPLAFAKRKLLQLQLATLI